jgi:Radical SAM superfamily/4Fe-4S single cluster domain
MQADRKTPFRPFKTVMARLYAFFGRHQNAPWLEAAANWFECNIMLRRRQMRRRSDPSDSDTEAYLKTHFCDKPFTTLETTHQGLAYVCCPIWLPTPIGKLDSDPKELWASPTAQNIRQSIIDGSFRHCSRVHCSAINNRALPRRDSKEAQEILKAHAAAGQDIPPPKHVILSHDKSCNLSCPSCRAVTIVANKAKQDKLDDLIERVIVPLLRGAETVNITGSGDPFGSNHFRRLIKRITNAQEFPRLKIDLHTNGQLWDQRAWRDLGLAGRVRNAHISIDAAEADTYAFVRRGGTFPRLLKNLEFVRDLRRSGELAQLEFSMVVQSRNFREIPAFVRLGADYAADTVFFQMIRKRDIFSGDEHKEAFIGDPNHPDYEEFVEVLQSPDLLHPRGSKPEVHLGNVLGYVNRAKPQARANAAHFSEAAE